jgi:hypothetical protein
LPTYRLPQEENRRRQQVWEGCYHAIQAISITILIICILYTLSFIHILIGDANIETHLSDVAEANATEPATEKHLVADSVASGADVADNTASEEPCVHVSKSTSPESPDSKQAPNAECGKSPSIGVHQTELFYIFSYVQY